MTYYNDKRRAFLAIEQGLKQAINDGRSININQWVYELTLVHPVGEKSLRERIQKAAARWANAVEISENTITPLVEVAA